MGCERLRRACAIALRTSIGIAIRKQPEIALVHLGATADLLGMRISDITPETVEQIAAVVVNYASSKEGADRVVDAITRIGGKAITVQANVTKKAEVEQLFAKTQHVFGRLDILVNNAGIYEYVPIEDITEEHFHKHFDLNVLGLILKRCTSPVVFNEENREHHYDIILSAAKQVKRWHQH